MRHSYILGPFAQIVTMDGLPARGPIEDGRLQAVLGGGLLIEGSRIGKVLGPDEFRRTSWDIVQGRSRHELLPVEGESVLLPGLIDSHTHICYAGSRSDDYAMRLRGESYQDIARAGGGIMSTVRATREASEDDLVQGLSARARRHLARGVTTCEVKSGYGLELDSELRMLRAIRRAGEPDAPVPELVPTCLAAHVPPPESRSAEEYLGRMASELLPIVKEEGLARRVDAYIDEGAFTPDQAENYLMRAKAMGFEITIHADQFGLGGSMVASRLGARSADHLEVSREDEFRALAASGVVAIALPGSSLGLGLPFANARGMLDRGLSVAIASDWNPGTAPMGDLMMQAAVLGAAQRLTVAETFAGVTVRAADALGLADRGVIREGMRADLVAYPCPRMEEILYRQGDLAPSLVVHGGRVLEPPRAM